MTRTNFLGYKLSKENKHYICIACVTINSVMRIEKNNYPQVYLEECKHKMKKTTMNKFINTEVKPDLESDSESESKSDTVAKLIANLEPASDSE